MRAAIRATDPVGVDLTTLTPADVVVEICLLYTSDAADE